MHRVFVHVIRVASRSTLLMWQGSPRVARTAAGGSPCRAFCSPALALLTAQCLIKLLRILTQEWVQQVQHAAELGMPGWDAWCVP